MAELNVKVRASAGSLTIATEAQDIVRAISVKVADQKRVLRIRVRVNGRGREVSIEAIWCRVRVGTLPQQRRTRGLGPNHMPRTSEVPAFALSPLEFCGFQAAAVPVA